MEQVKLEPIILNPNDFVKKETLQPSSTWRRNFGLMLTGWVVGNLLVGGLLGLGVIGVIASTGLVKVPLLTARFFPKVAAASVSSKELSSANQKLSKIYSLKDNQSLAQLSFTEEELTAILSDTFNKKGVTIVNPSVEVTQSGFTLNGYLKETSAPVQVTGHISSNSGVLSLSLTKTTFGKMNLPTSLASLILNADLEKAGLSLSSSPIPAQQVVLGNGKVILENITNQSQ